MENNKLSFCPAIPKMGQCKECTDLADKVIADADRRRDNYTETENDFFGKSFVFCNATKKFCPHKDKIKTATETMNDHSW